MSLVRRIGIPVAAVSALSIGAATVSYFEGKENRAYVDPVGVVTICYGHTATARIGQSHSDAECDRLLREDLGDAFDAVDTHVDVELPATREAALASFVYNVGEGAFKRSTLLRKLNSGHWREACDELMRWVYAGGRQLRGLVRRRQAERELCLMELDDISDMARAE